MKPYALVSSFLFALFVTFMFALVPLNAQAAEKPVVTPSKEQPRMKPGTEMPKKAVNCPSGWHMLPGGDPKGHFMCAPNKPAPIQCPPKYQYVQKDCIVGCQPIIY